MTAGVVGVLAEALAQHPEGGARVVSSGEDQLTVLEFDCGCGWSVQGNWADGSPYPAHVASVVAALPNIAVVMLPEPTVREHGGFSWGADEDDENPTVTATAGYDTVRLYQEDARHTSGDAVEIAGFLLAAARAAGGQA